MRPFPESIAQRRRALALFATVLVALVFYGVEFILWTVDPARGLPPNGTIDGRYVTWGHVWGDDSKVAWRSWTFRQRPFPLEKPHGVYRILVAGDSYTFGVGLAEQDRYTERLQIKLQRAQPHKRWEVLNFGLMGAPTTFERDVLVDGGPPLNPDQLVVGFCFNDVDPAARYPTAEHQQFDAYHGWWIRAVESGLGRLGLPRLGIHFHQAAQRWGELSGRIPDYSEQIRRAYDPESDKWKSFVAALRDIKAFSDRRGLPAPVFAVLVAAQSSLEFTDPSPGRRIAADAENRAAAAAEKLGFRVVRFEEAVRRLPPELDLRVNRADGHPGAALNEIFAEGLFQCLANEGKNVFLGPTKSRK